MGTTITTNESHGFSVGEPIGVPLSVLLSEYSWNGDNAEPLDKNDHDLDWMRYAIIAVHKNSFDIGVPTAWDRIRWWFRDLLRDTMRMWYDIQDARE